MKSVIFVCLGNICRSSLAEGVAKTRVKKLGVEMKSEFALASFDLVLALDESNKKELLSIFGYKKG